MADDPVDLTIRSLSRQSAQTAPEPAEHEPSLRRPASASQLSNRSTHSLPRPNPLPQLSSFLQQNNHHGIEEDNDHRPDPFMLATSPGGPLSRPTPSFPPSPRRPGPTIPPQTPPESIRDGSIRTGPRSPTTSGQSVSSPVMQQQQVLSGIGAVAAIQRSQSHSATQPRPSSQLPPRTDRIGTSSRSLSGPTPGGTVTGAYDMSSAPGVSAGANWVQQEQYRREEAYATSASKANHLPPMGPGFSGLTSLPISEVQRDIEFSIKALLSPKLFVRLMEDPLARHRFREHCELFENGTQLFDSWLDLRSLAVKLEAAEMAASAVQDLYLAPSAPLTFAGLGEHDQEQLSEATTLSTQISPFLEGPQKRLMDELYHNQFMSFLKYKMIEGATWRLGKYNLDDSDVTAGLGDCICLTNPRLRDHPIVLVSEGFSNVTGYSARSIVGRNCRFLQGPATSPEAVDRVRQALNKGETATNLLINYRRDGTAFFNLLCIMPLRDSTGQISYFLGGQVNVTSFLSSDRGLSFLVGGSHADLENLPPANTAAQSPVLSAYLSTMQASSLNAKAYPLHYPKIRKAAGEAHDSAYSSNRKPFVAPGAGRGDGAAGGIGAGKQEGTMGRIAQVLGIKEKKSAAKRFEEGECYGKQKIVGAEGTLDKRGGGVETQIEAFQHTYTRALIFRKDAKRSIIFVTEPLLKYVGLPHKTPLELYSSKLLHKDLFEIVEGAERESTANLKRSLKVAINANRAYSTPCGIKSSFKTNMLGQPVLEGAVKFCTIHLTPLADSEGNCEAFCCIVG